MTKPIYVCKKCGSDRIRQTVYVWYNSMEECGHRAETEHEEPALWCANCNSRETVNVACCLPEIDIRQLCTYCGSDTAWHAGNGLFVDRIPSDADGKLVLSGGDATIDVVINGYMCVDCQTHTCDGCGTPTHEYEILDKATPEVVCSSCLKEGE